MAGSPVIRPMWGWCVSDPARRAVRRPHYVHDSPFGRMTCGRMALAAGCRSGGLGARTSGGQDSPFASANGRHQALVMDITVSVLQST